MTTRARILICLAVGAGCKSRVPAEPTATTVATAADAARPDAAPPDAAPPDAAGPPAPALVPPEVADPQPFVFRRVSHGCIVNPLRRTSILRRAGNHASLRVITETASLDRGAPPPYCGSLASKTWQIKSSETFVGTLSTDAMSILLHLASPTGKPLELACRARRIAVHAEGAELIQDRSKPHQQEAAWAVAWRPAGVQDLDVLACAQRGVQDERDVLVMSPLPGVELYSVNSDILLQGWGYRRMSSP